MPEEFLRPVKATVRGKHHSDNEGQMAAFGFVQHNFFILFNAMIGLVFWRRAQKELFARSLRFPAKKPLASKPSCLCLFLGSSRPKLGESGTPWD